MTLKRVFRFFMLVLMAGGLSWQVYRIESQDAIRDHINVGLRLAKQTASQIQTLTLYAQANEEQDPLSWAVRFLTVGSETRLIQIMPIQDAHSQPETTEYEPERGQFIYSRTILPEKNAAVQITIDLGYVGFLGTRSQWKNDLSLAGLFLFFLSVFMCIANLVKNPREEITKDTLPTFEALTPASSSRPISETELTEFLSIWVVEAKSMLLQVGVHLKYLIRSAQNIAALSVNSREAVVKLKENIHNRNPEIDAAFHSYEGLSRTTGEMNECISQATDALLKEAKMFQDLKVFVKKTQTRLESTK